MKFNTIFENQNFIVVDKPSGVLSTPARLQEQDSRLCLGTFLQEQLQIQIYPVHRLDFEVSGLVIYAKNPQAHRAANAWFEQKTIRKSYRALTRGPDFSHLPVDVPRVDAELIVGQKQIWKCQLLRGKKRAFASPHGKLSVTEAFYLGVDEQQIHSWDLNPITGRSHQLRYEMSRHGLPILGDKLYGSKEALTQDHIALRSYLLDFTRCSEYQKWGFPTELRVEAVATVL